MTWRNHTPQQTHPACRGWAPLRSSGCCWCPPGRTPLQSGCHWTGRLWACCPRRSNDTAAWCLKARTERNTCCNVAEELAEERQRYNMDNWHFIPSLVWTFFVLDTVILSFSQTWVNVTVFDLTFSKLLFAVLLGDFHLEYLVLTDEGSHLG